MDLFPGAFARSCEKKNDFIPKNHREISHTSPIDDDAGRKFLTVGCPRRKKTNKNHFFYNCEKKYDSKAPAARFSAFFTVRYFTASKAGYSDSSYFFHSLIFSAHFFAAGRGFFS